MPRMYKWNVFCKTPVQEGTEDDAYEWNKSIVNTVGRLFRFWKFFRLFLSQENSSFFLHISLCISTICTDRNKTKLNTRQHSTAPKQTILTTGLTPIVALSVDIMLLIVVNFTDVPKRVFP